jgi:hypothetical protein
MPTLHRALATALVFATLYQRLVGAQQVPPNDLCEEAVDLTEFSSPIGASVDDWRILQGSTVDATDEDPNLCGVTAASKRGIWYLYQNSSIPEDSTSIVTVSTCNEATDFDTALTLYEGFCSGLSCVHATDNDLECRTGSDVHTTISWHAERGTRYYLLVHGSRVNNTGSFGLTVTTEEPLPTTDISSDSNTPDSGAAPVGAYLSFTWWALPSLALVIFS